VSGPRTFAALIAQHGVTLVEHQRDHGWVRAIEQWTDPRPAASIDEAVARLSALLTRTGARRPRLALVIEQFGVVHHIMTLPRAGDDVVEPIVKRELQRAFGANDPVVAFTRGDAPGADPKAPQQVVIAAAPRDTLDALRALAPTGARIEIATVVPKAMHSLYELGGASKEPTAVLVCLQSGPHLAFFLDGRLELAIDPPIALEGDRPTVAMILDQVERGAVYFRQQFRGAEATRVLLAARADEYAEIASAIESRITARVKPLFKGSESPEAVVAIGAALEGRHKSPLDLYPHPLTPRQRVLAHVRGPERYVTAAVAAAAIAFVWSAMQVVPLLSANRETARLRESMTAAAPAIAPMRQVAQRRADLVAQANFARDAIEARGALTRTLSAIAANAPDGISFDTVHVERAGDGWSAVIEGRASGSTTTQAVFSLDALLKDIRALHTVTGAALDDFDYPQPDDDSLPRAGEPVTIAFHLSFTARRAGEVR
jgi:hypothetical protein